MLNIELTLRFRMQLIDACIKAGVRVEPIPGACAAAAAVSVAGANEQAQMPRPLVSRVSGVLLFTCPVCLFVSVCVCV
jgi:hypothetical protein